MKQYFVLIVFLALILFAIHDGHAQTASVSTDVVSISKDVVIILDSSGGMKESSPEFPVGGVVSAILESLSKDSRVSFAIPTEIEETVMPLTFVTDEGVGKKATEALSKLGDVKPAEVITVTIKKGDTLWKLADRYYGDPDKWRIILDNNRLPKRGNDLTVGSVIRIPDLNAKSYPRGSSGKKRASVPAMIEQAIYSLKQDGRKVAEKQIILITDRPSDIKDSALAVERYRWLKDELAESSKTAGIRIFSIALTERVDFELMQVLAQKTDGGYYRVSGAEDIQIALNGMSEPVLKTQAVSQTEPSVAQTEITPAKPEGRFPIRFSKGLLLVVLAAAGLVLLSIVVFAIIKGRKRTQKRSRSSSIAGGSYLMDLSGATEKSNYAISRSITKIGRGKSEDVDICINKGTISGVHAQIEHRDNNFYLTDLGSTNGTYLNDDVEKITDETRLNAGDIISFDQYKFKLVVRGQGGHISDQSGESQGAGTQEELSPGSPSVPRKPAAVSLLTAEEIAVDKTVEALDVYLIDTGGVTNKESHRIKKRITRVGRTAVGVDIHIDADTISGLHAQIEYRDHEFYLTDLQSRNGTYLNEERARITSEICLHGNDTIYFDQLKFQFVIHKQSKHEELQLSASPSGEIGE